MIIYDDNKIMVKDYLSIRFMDSSDMIVEMDEYNIVVIGEGFEIEYYDYTELKMKGKIKVIECNEDRV